MLISSKNKINCALTISKGRPPKSIQPSPMVKRSYNSILTSKSENKFGKHVAFFSDEKKNKLECAS